MKPSSNLNLSGSNWLAKMGMILIKLTDQNLINSLDSFCEEKEHNDKYYELLIDIHKDTERVLSKCPDVKNLRWLRDLRKADFMLFKHHDEEDDDYFMQEFSSFLYFDLYIPKSERCYAFDVRYHENVIEKYHVIYNGMYFLAFAEISDDNSTAFFGQEIREFLLTRLVSDRWKGVAVPPCPLHPEVFIKDSKKFGITTNEEDDIEVLVQLGNIDELIDFFEYFLFENSLMIRRFLSACTMESKMSRTSSKIEEILALLANGYTDLMKLPWYSILRKLALMKSSREMALDLHVKCNEYTKYQLWLSREKEFFDPRESGKRNQTPFLNYFFRHFQNPDFSVSEIRETANHMTDIVSDRYLQYTTLFAAIVGGIIGAIVTNITFLMSIISRLFKS